jgi:flagellar hook-basal body complex protein FliE
LGGENASSAGMSFKDVLEGIKNVYDKNKYADQVGMQSITNNVDPLEMVTAFNQAHASLQMLTTISSKTIQAFQEVKNMPL